MARNLIVLGGLLYARVSVGVQIGPLVGALGVSGIAIAFAVTAILENVFASVMPKTRRPIRVGDQVSTPDRDGTVTEINFRHVLPDSLHGKRVVIHSPLALNAVTVDDTPPPPHSPPPH